MRATQLLDSLLRGQCQEIHKMRMKALFKCVEALLRGRKLSVTGLGRAMGSDAKVKHNIKCADRLIGNPQLNQDRPVMCRAVTQLVLARQRQPVIIIDWSDLTVDRSLLLLRASVPLGGRAITLYEEVHSQRYDGNPRIQKRFLQRLKDIVPAQCRPILVTDAGFRTPWFRAVQDMGWDFVGRVGRRALMRPKGKGDWVGVKEVFETATSKARCLGEVELVRNHPLLCQGYLLKRKAKGRVERNRYGEKAESKYSRKNAERERQPWLIVTSLSGGAGITKHVINIYKTRMQIEEAFRDVKNSRWGFSLDEARSTTHYRYENLLLVAQLATLAVWLVGQVAEMKQWHRHYQANTVRTEKVLSTIFLGLAVIGRGLDQFLKPDFTEAIRQIRLRITREAGWA